MITVAAGGCASSGALRKGKVAENKGEFQQAYVIYAAAARHSPTTGSLARALARVGPKAVRYWCRAGSAFEAEGSFDRAWRCYMRALLIDPSDPEPLAAVERLGREHPDTAGACQVAWQRYGERSLQVGRVPDFPGEETAGDFELPAVLEPDTRPFPRPGEARESEPSGPPGCVAEVTISHEDDRYPRRAFLYDGLSIEIRDTDSHPRADLVVYLGHRRVLKAKNLRPGEDARVVGRSGRPYAIRILAIEHDHETARVGLFSEEE